MIGIYGASGFIGRHLFLLLQQKQRECIGTCYRHQREGLFTFNILEDSPEIFDRCDVVIIAGAVSTMADCSDDPDYSRSVNVEGVIKLATYLNDKDIKIIYLSSNQVFSGKKGNYKETDSPDPETLYGKQKYLVEQAIQSLNKNHLILRLSKVYSSDIIEDTLYSQIVIPLREGKQVKAAENQIYNPTEVNEVCQKILHSINQDLQGVYHLANEKIQSRYDFAINLADELGVSREYVEAFDLLTLPLDEYPPLNGGMLVEKMRKDVV